MTNLEKLESVFCEVFGVEPSVLGDGFDSSNVEGWDSVRQLSLTTRIEDTFGLLLDPEDIVDMVSFNNAKKILEKYNIES